MKAIVEKIKNEIETKKKEIETLKQALDILEVKSERKNKNYIPHGVNKYKKWTTDEDKLLCDMYRTGTPVKKIAKTLRRTAYAVRRRARDLNVLHGKWNKTE